MLSQLHKVEIIKIKIFISCEDGAICHADRVHHNDGINCDVRCVCSTISRKHASVTKVFFPVSLTNTHMKSHINHQHVCITSERLERVFRMYHVQAYSVKSVVVDSCKNSNQLEELTAYETFRTRRVVRMTNSVKITTCKCLKQSATHQMCTHVSGNVTYSFSIAMSRFCCN